MIDKKIMLEILEECDNVTGFKLETLEKVYYVGLDEVRAEEGYCVINSNGRVNIVPYERVIGIGYVQKDMVGGLVG